jgi:hypothetical protein
MPYLIERLANGKYMVFNGSTGHVFSKGTTLAKAKSQVKFLHMVDNVQRINFNPEWEKNYRTKI